MITGPLWRAASIATLACAALALSVGAQTAPGPLLELNLGEERWTSTPTPGVQSALVWGDLERPGLYILRGKLAKGAKIMPHTHPDVRYGTVLSGEVLFGFGETFDEAKMKTYAAGAMVIVPADAPHYIWAKKGEVVFQDMGIGPTATVPVAK